MASQGTPINQLPQQQEDDKQFVQNIINQMQTDNQEADQAYNQTQQQYQQQQFAVNQQQQHMQNQQMQQMQQQQEYQDEDVEYEETEEIVKPEVSNSLMDTLKMPLLFLALFVILSVPFIRQFASAQVNRFTDNESMVLYGGILLLGIVGGVIFFAANKFL